MTRWSSVWWGLVATFLALALGVPALAEASFSVVVAAEVLLLAAILAMRQAFHAAWSEDVDTFAEALTLVSDALDAASRLAITSARDLPGWRQTIVKVPWPNVLPLGEPRPGLGVWYSANKGQLTESQEDLFAVLRQFETHVHRGDVSLARRRMRVIADSWDAWHFFPGFRGFFRREVLPYYAHILKLLAYIEIQHAEHVRARPGPGKGWVRLGTRWCLT